HDLVHGRPIVLPAVAGDQDHLPAAVVQLVEDGGGEAKLRAHGGLQGVDDRVAGEEDPLGDILPGQVVPVGGGGAEVKLGDGPHHFPVHLLGVGGPPVPG